MNTKKIYRVAILGIGGVGGYIGAKLAETYTNSEETEIIFIARGGNERTIKETGLRLITPERECISRPALVSSDPSKVGIVDLLICAVKSFDLIESIRLYQTCVGSNTIILPLENGMEASEKIKTVIPDATIWEGCIYLNSRLIAPGVINQIGSNHTIYFSSDAASKTELQKVKNIFKNAGIDALVSENIQLTLWEKFVFISAIATLTSYLNISIGEIFNSDQNADLLSSLIKEATSVAKAKGISLPWNIREKLFEKASSMPYDATSSMHTDFKNNKQTEIDSLTGYVVNQGKLFKIPTPDYERILFYLLEKQKLSNVTK